MAQRCGEQGEGQGSGPKKFGFSTWKCCLWEMLLWFTFYAAFLSLVKRVYFWVAHPYQKLCHLSLPENVSRGAVEWLPYENPTIRNNLLTITKTT